MRRLALALLALALLAAAAPGAAAPAGDADSPAGPFASPSEVTSTLEEVEDHPWITVHELGESVRERPIHVAEVADPTSEVPREERVVTFVLTQQHGDEPAGTPAALELLERVARGEPVIHNLSNQVLLVLPQANPDGAADGTRENARDVDLNRDHVALREPETRAMHEVLTRWDVDVALDMHEYGGFGAGNPVPARVYDHDLLTLYPKHGNVPDPARSAAKAVMYEGIWPEAREEGYSVNEYGEVTVADRPVREIAGGPDPGIQRNHWGLHNVASLLVESRIDAHPNPFHDAERRIDIHRTVLNATVSYSHDHAAFLRSAPDEAAASAEAHPFEEYREGDRVGKLAAGYRVPAETPVPELARAHGLEGSLQPGSSDESLLVRTDGARQGHAAALVHPQSSRALVDGEPVFSGAEGALDRGVTPQDAEPASADGSQAPGPGLVLALAGVGAAAVAAGRRR